MFGYKIIKKRDEKEYEQFKMTVEAGDDLSKRIARYLFDICQDMQVTSETPKDIYYLIESIQAVIDVYIANKFSTPSHSVGICDIKKALIRQITELVQTIITIQITENLKDPEFRKEFMKNASDDELEELKNSEMAETMLSNHMIELTKRLEKQVNDATDILQHVNLIFAYDLQKIKLNFDFIKDYYNREKSFKHPKNHSMKVEFTYLTKSDYYALKNKEENKNVNS